MISNDNMVFRCDEKGNTIYTKNLYTGLEEEIRRNKNGQIIHIKRSDGSEKCIDRDENGKIIRITYYTKRMAYEANNTFEQSRNILNWATVNNF